MGVGASAAGSERERRNVIIRFSAQGNARMTEKHSTECEDATDARAPFKVLERCDRVFQFDLIRMIEFGPEYNQAVKDVADAVREILRERRT